MSRKNDATRKVRSDAVLKNLEDERQAEILEYTRKHRLADTAKWLAQDGITISGPALSNWRAWYLQKLAYDQREERILNKVLYYKEGHPKATKKELDDLGEDLFNRLAIDQEDVRAWSMAQQIQLKRERQAQQKKMVVLASKKLDLAVQKSKDEAAKAAKDSARPKMTREEKEARMKEVLTIE